MRIVIWLLTSLLLLVSSSCATAPTDATKPPGVDVTGTWSGTWSWSGGPGGITMTLLQMGAEVTGDMSWSGALRSGSTVRGRVAGDVLTFRAPGVDLTGDLDVKDNKMIGWGRSAGYSIRMQLQRRQ